MTIFSRITPFTKLRKRTEVMFDMETLGKRAGFAVLTLGAVAFDPRAPFGTDQQEISLGNQFMAKISLESCKEAGLLIDDSTVEWWEKQSPEAVEEAFGGTTPLKEALEAYSAWLIGVCGEEGEGIAACNVWSHGEDFDQPILNHAYEALGLTKPWAYNAGRDTRTVLDMANVAYKGVSHMAVKDALDQAAAVRQAFHNLGLDDRPQNGSLLGKILRWIRGPLF